jgi:hypothetical protein
LVKEVSQEDRDLGNNLAREISSLVTLRVTMEAHRDQTPYFYIIIRDVDDKSNFESRAYCTKAGATRLLNNRRSLVAFTKKLLATYAVGRFYEVVF